MESKLVLNVIADEIEKEVAQIWLEAHDFKYSSVTREAYAVSATTLRGVVKRLRDVAIGIKE